MFYNILKESTRTNLVPYPILWNELLDLNNCDTSNSFASASFESKMKLLIISPLLYVLVQNCTSTDVLVQVHVCLYVYVFLEQKYSVGRGMEDVEPSIYDCSSTQLEIWLNWSSPTRWMESIIQSFIIAMNKPLFRWVIHCPGKNTGPPF